jgi:alpha,alpha-trehalase
MALGVVETEHEQLILDMAENMAFLINRFGLIPNGSRYYFLSRSQPPFFTALIWLAYQVKQRRGDTDTEEYLRQMMQIAEKEYETVWMGTAQPHHRQVFAGLSRYFDINYLDVLAACESGWDHTTRCDDRWLDHLPADLNALLYMCEQDFARAAEMFNQRARAASWRERAHRRAETMHRLMWDEEQGLFLDWDWKQQQRNPHPSLAAFYPLFAGLARPEQAARMVRDWLPQFEHPGGLVTTLEERAGRQWAYPNGWAPLQWVVTTGLERYGYQAEAQRIMRKWCDNCATVFAATGCMWEKYAVVAGATIPEEGLYGSVPGFGWSNAVFADFARRLEME